MRNRPATLATVLVFAAAVGTAAVVAGSRGGPALEKLPVPAAAGTDAASAGGRGVSLSYPAPGAGVVEYRVAGQLPALDGPAPAWRLARAAGAGEVARLARDLGIDGAVEADGEGWTVRSGGRELRVQAGPGLPWFLGPACPDMGVASDDPAMGEPVCATAGAVSVGGESAGSEPGPPATDPSEPAQPPKPAEARPVPGCAGAGATCSTAVPPDAPPPDARPAPAPAPVLPEAPSERPPRPAGLPTRAEAESAARELFTRLGVGTHGLVVEDGWSTWEARAERRVGGVGVLWWYTTASVGAGGEVVRASGYLGEPERIGDYPLVGTAAGLERLREGALGGPVPMLAEDLAGAEAGPGRPEGPAVGVPPEGPAPDCASPTVTCDPPPDAAPRTVTVTGARLALVQVEERLVPVYVFALDGDGESAPVPAVTGEWLLAT